MPRRALVFMQFRKFWCKLAFQRGDQPGAHPVSAK